MYASIRQSKNFSAPHPCLLYCQIPFHTSILINVDYDISILYIHKKYIIHVKQMTVLLYTHLLSIPLPRYSLLGNMGLEVSINPRV